MTENHSGTGRFPQMYGLMNSMYYLEENKPLT